MVSFYPTRVSSLALACLSSLSSCKNANPSAAAPTGSVPAAAELAAMTRPSAAPAAPPAILAGTIDDRAPAGASAAAPPTSPARPMTSVLVLGDSLSDETVGGGGFVKILRARCSKVTFEN